jgi:hypothetical protein
MAILNREDKIPKIGTTLRTKKWRGSADEKLLLELARWIFTIPFLISNPFFIYFPPGPVHFPPPGGMLLR